MDKILIHIMKQGRTEIACKKYCMMLKDDS